MITARDSAATAVVAAAVVPKLPVIADTKGRLRVTPAQRRDILAAFGRSGESLPGFARRTGLKYSTLARWVQHRRPKPAGRKPAFRLLEALVPAAPGSAPAAALVVELPGGARLAVADAQQAALAATLVRALAQPC
ncbi:MAG TPA: hypothetical protein VL527_08850 [Dongiaceae bacterium]|nr:hypothetical protein [Dongiaceae bacterium]